MQPEDFRDWNIPEEEYAEITSERRRIVSLVNSPAREQYASKVAHAQVLFDCWVEQVDEQWSGGKSSVCAKQFKREMADIESQILLASPPRPSSRVVKEVVRYEPVEATHTLFFGFNLTEISERGRAVISSVSELVKRMANYSIDVDGYTDTAGPTLYNQMLSKERADKVAEALVKQGVDRSYIKAHGHGENGLLTPTSDGVIERKNRRVEVRVRGQKRLDGMRTEHQNRKNNNTAIDEIQKAPEVRPIISDSTVENETTSEVSVDLEKTSLQF